MENIYDARGNAVQRYIDILTNGGFKALFGDVNNKEAVMTIMNALLPEHRKVVDIEYMPTEHQGQISDNKEYHYDFMCRDEDGAIYIVEMQRYAEEHWFKRCVSYASRAYDRQNRRERIMMSLRYILSVLWAQRYCIRIRDSGMTVLFRNIRFGKKRAVKCLMKQ